MKPPSKPQQAIPTHPRTSGASCHSDALLRAYSAISVAAGAALVGLGFTLAATIGFYTLDWLYCVTHPGVCS